MGRHEKSPMKQRKYVQASDNSPTNRTSQKTDHSSKSSLRHVDVRPRPALRRSSSEGSAHSLRRGLSERSFVLQAQTRIRRRAREEGSFLDILSSWMSRVLGFGRPNSPMDTILPHLLLGNDAAASHYTNLFNAGVTHICNVASQCDVHFHGKFIYLHLHLRDTPTQNLSKHFDSVLDFIHRAKELDGRVLVHCVAGVSRSVCFVIAYLMKHCLMRLVQAYDYVKLKRPIMCPNPSFKMQLVMYEINLFESSSVLASDDREWDFYELNTYRRNRKR